MFSVIILLLSLENMYLFPLGIQHHYCKAALKRWLQILSENRKLELFYYPNIFSETLLLCAWQLTHNEIMGKAAQLTWTCGYKSIKLWDLINPVHDPTQFLNLLNATVKRICKPTYFSCCMAEFRCIIFTVVYKCNNIARSTQTSPTHPHQRNQHVPVTHTADIISVHWAVGRMQQQTDSATTARLRGCQHILCLLTRALSNNVKILWAWIFHLALAMPGG